jgi:hypothetical protein
MPANTASRNRGGGVSATACVSHAAVSRSSTTSAAQDAQSRRWRSNAGRHQVVELGEGPLVAAGNPGQQFVGVDAPLRVGHRDKPLRGQLLVFGSHVAHSEPPAARMGRGPVPALAT